MKKGRLFLPLLLAAAISLNAIPAPHFTETVYAEEEGTETEHPESYYQEIQSNNFKEWPQGPKINAEAAIVMDAKTGAILYAKNIDKREYPASITKIMTVLLALEKGNLKDVVKFSEYAVYSIEFNSSHLGLTEGEELTLEQCLYGVMLASANEVSNAVAEHIGGDVETFVQMMNDRAKELGCKDTHFVNPHGLHDENHYVTAHDMARIMRAAMRNKKFREIISTVEYHYPETNLVDEVRYFMNHHKMISEEGMLYEGCLGGKTGFTDEAYNTLVTAAKRDGQEIISVVLRAPGLYVVYEDTKSILDYGLEQFENKKLDNVNSPQMEIVGVEDEVELERIQKADFSKEPFSMPEKTMVSVPNGTDLSMLTKKLNMKQKRLTYYLNGQAVGSTRFKYTGNWEEEASDLQTEVQTELETEKTTENVAEKTSILQKVTGAVLGWYHQVDTFIKENTVIASVLGALLLLIFLPLLLVTVNRHRKYMRIMQLRYEEMQLRRRLEEEIERKSAAQIEAELRAEELQMQLNEEKKKQRQLEEQMKHTQPEPNEIDLDDEYIEVSLDEEDE